MPPSAPAISSTTCWSPPGAELAQVAFRVEGAGALRIDAGGSLVIETSAGPIAQRPPRTWELDADGGQRPVRCRYVRLDERTYGFAAPGRRVGRALVVDPALVWSTLTGGTKSDWGAAVSVDDRGRTTLVG